jgi:hypothetical protein
MRMNSARQDRLGFDSGAKMLDLIYYQLANVLLSR